MHKLLLNIPTRLDAERLIVRKYAEGDGRELLMLLERNDNREFLRENVEEVSFVRTEEEAEISVRKHSIEWFARDRFVMGVWLRSEDRCVGQIWIEPKNWDVPSFEIGWFLDQGYQGRGIAEEAARCSLEFLFSNLNAHKVIAIMRDTNFKSIRLAERLGFRREGHLRESGIQDGKRYGLLYYGMLRTEFSSNQNSGSARSSCAIQRAVARGEATDKLEKGCASITEDLAREKAIMKDIVMYERGELKFIGIVESASEMEARVRIFPEFCEGLRKIGEFSHLIVLYWIHLRDKEEERRALQVIPRRHAVDAEVGVFACRSPSRPNPIGLCVVELVKIDTCNLTVKGLDAIEGSPIIDIKPYFPRADSVPDARVPDWALRGSLT